MIFTVALFLSHLFLFSRTFVESLLLKKGLNCSGDDDDDDDTLVEQLKTTNELFLFVKLSLIAFFMFVFDQILFDLGSIPGNLVMNM